MTTDGVARIALERLRQQDEEGFDEAHDDCQFRGELCGAAATYAQYASDQIFGDLRDHEEYLLDMWPGSWREDQFNPSKNPIRNLTKAGALIAAEIDRILRERARVRKGEDGSL